MECEPPDDCDGVYCYIDPPYSGTTGYPFGNLTRAEVTAVARRWSGAGAVVAISEAEPVEMGAGWEAIDIGGGRVGQKRTFGGTSEWLTMNRVPSARVATQLPLLGGAA